MSEECGTLTENNYLHSMSELLEKYGFLRCKKCEGEVVPVGRGFQKCPHCGGLHFEHPLARRSKGGKGGWYLPTTKAAQ